MRSAAFLALLLATSSGQELATGNPFVGEWVANISKSRQSPDYRFQAATLRIFVDGETITMSSRLIDPSGEQKQAAETFRTDGTETPGKLTPGILLAARWLGTHVLATIAKKGNETIALVTYEVSSDGKTMTLRSSGTVEHVIVFDRK
jgi:hypothetical protein